MARQQDDARAIQTWLRYNAIPIHHVGAGCGFVDLQPLKTILQGVRVIGLGEATHGTREFFQLKHRLLEFLVTEMQFTAFALEASYAACQPINDYIRYGKGDRATVLTGQGYVLWDTEELSAMLDWLRSYNQSVADEQQVTFHGLDITMNALGRQAVLDYLNRVAPDTVSSTEELFLVLAEEEAKWPMRIDDASKARLRVIQPQLRNLISYLADNKDTLISKSSAADFNRISRYIHVMQQWLMFTVGDGDRSRYMAENLIHLLEWERPDAKCVVWEHNSHISLMSTWSEQANFGYSLREKYGDSYFAVSLELYEGSYQARTLLPDNVLGDLKEVTLPPASVGSLPWHVLHSGMGQAFVDLRAPTGHEAVEQWLTSPQRLPLAGWVYDESASPYIELSLRTHYDGSIAIQRTTSTRPTVNAMEAVAKREPLRL